MYSKVLLAFRYLVGTRTVHFVQRRRAHAFYLHAAKQNNLARHVCSKYCTYHRQLAMAGAQCSHASHERNEQKCMKGNGQRPQCFEQSRQQASNLAAALVHFSTLSDGCDGDMVPFRPKPHFPVLKKHACWWPVPGRCRSATHCHFFPSWTLAVQHSQLHLATANATTMMCPSAHSPPLSFHFSKQVFWPHWIAAHDDSTASATHSWWDLTSCKSDQWSVHCKWRIFAHCGPSKESLNHQARKWHTWWAKWRTHCVQWLVTGCHHQLKGPWMTDSWQFKKPACAMCHKGDCKEPIALLCKKPCRKFQWSHLMWDKGTIWWAVISRRKT